MKITLIFVVNLMLVMIAIPVQATCKGCLCPGDPCGLCPLPATKDALIKPNEADICAKIREKVAPITALPGENEYFPSLDRAMMVCVREGGDVLKNSRRSEAYPSRFYCKPPIAPSKANIE